LAAIPGVEGEAPALSWSRFINERSLRGISRVCVLLMSVETVAVCDCTRGASPVTSKLCWTLHRELEIDRDRVSGREFHSGANELLEAGVLYSYTDAACRKRTCGVLAAVVGGRSACKLRALVDERHRDAGDNGARLIGYCADDVA
jgi:hypothetical protein